MRKTKKQRFRASILAFLLIASMVLGMAPGSAGQVYVILSILVDTFISKISLPMQPVPEIGSISGA